MRIFSRISFNRVKIRLVVQVGPEETQELDARGARVPALRRLG